MSDWASARNVLCVRLDSLGDVLMTTPAIRALKHGHKNRRITLLTSAAGAAVARLVPEIDDVIHWDAPWLKASRLRTDSGEDRSFCDALRAEAFDAAVIFTVFSQSALPAALFCSLADIPLRLAYCRENPYQLLSDWVPEIEPQHGIRHEVERQLQLVASIGCLDASTRLSLKVPAGDHRLCDSVIADTALDLESPWLVIHPGATAPSRRYPIGQFAAVADRLCERGFQIVMTGTADERSLIDEMKRAMRSPGIDLAGQLALGPFAALLDRSALLVTNNTGPAHLAAAVGTPVVDLYALTNPQHTPWKVPSRVLSYDVPCRNCFKSVCPEGHHDCLRRVTPEQVVAATLDLYRETAHARRLTASDCLVEKVA